LHITLLKAAGRHLRFSDEFFATPGNVYLHQRKKEIKISKRIVHTIAVFKRVLQMYKLLVLKYP
jgi:hypothetical protein